MYFNGFTLLLMMISAIGGIVLGVKIEAAHQERMQELRERDRERFGRTIEAEMKRDGWTL
jgi:hypothetical protein